MRFRTLDGLRGIAAILVLFYHLGGQAPLPVAAGYLAVDLFFALSGFVISHAYGARLRDGLTLPEFAVLRLVRVYPMAFVGAAIGVVLSGQFVPSLLLVPHFDPAGLLYPVNAPLWSLAFELIVNLAFAVVAPRLGRRELALILAASGAILALGATRYSVSELGAFWSTAGYGLARTTFSFTVGVAIQRMHARFAIGRRETRLALLLPLALVVLLAGIPAHRAGWELACIVVLLPVTLWLSTVWEMPGIAPVARELGELSYPLYCIQGAVIQACAAAGGPPGYLWLLLIVVAWWLNSRVDHPLRQLLLQRMGMRQPAPTRA